MKDYNHYRKNFISYYHDHVSYNIDRLHELKLTPIEGIVMFQLVMLQHYFGAYYFHVLPQCKIKEKDYTVDFIVRFELPDKPVKRIVIECDGHDYHEKTKEQASKDKKRDRELQKLGFIILRYSGSDIVNDPEKVVKDLDEILGIPDWAKPKYESQ